MAKMARTKKAPKLCAGCQAKVNDYTAALNREKYAARKRSGLCPRCGERPPGNGASVCAHCAEGAVRRQRRSYARNRQGASMKRCSGCGGRGHNVRSCSRSGSHAEVT